MPAYVPRARRPIRMSQLPEETERQSRPTTRQPLKRDIPPHINRETQNAHRSTSQGSQWRQQQESEQTHNRESESVPVRESASTAKPTWRKLMEETLGVHYAAFERSRRPYRWSGIPAASTSAAAAAAAPEPDPLDSSDDEDKDPRDRGRPGHHRGMEGVPPMCNSSRDQNNNQPSGSGGMAGGGGSPDNPGDDQYNNQDSEDSDSFPHHPYRPPYGRYFHAKPPHPKANINAANYYRIPYYHYQAGWPCP